MLEIEPVKAVVVICNDNVNGTCDLKRAFKEREKTRMEEMGQDGKGKERRRGEERRGQCNQERTGKGVPVMAQW